MPVCTAPSSKGRVARAADPSRMDFIIVPGRLDIHRLAEPGGEEGVEAAVLLSNEDRLLSSEDRRDPARYESSLRPILERMKKNRRPGS